MKGNRGPEDRIIIIKTSYGSFEPISLKALLQIIQLFMENEDRLHPRSRGEKGRWLLYEAISELANGKDFETVANNYLIPKHIKTAKKLMLEKMSEDERQKHLDMFGDEE